MRGLGNMIFPGLAPVEEWVIINICPGGLCTKPMSIYGCSPRNQDPDEECEEAPASGSHHYSLPSSVSLSENAKLLVSFQIYRCDCFAVTQFSGQVRHKGPPKPKLRFPLWYLQKTRVVSLDLPLVDLNSPLPNGIETFILVYLPRLQNYPEKITPENREFIKEVGYEKFGPPAVISGISTFQTNSPLKDQPLQKGVWTPKSRRCGLITRKIGLYPMWSKSGEPVWTTLLQVRRINKM